MVEYLKEACVIQRLQGYLHSHWMGFIKFRDRFGMSDEHMFEANPRENIANRSRSPRTARVDKSTDHRHRILD